MPAKLIESLRRTEQREMRKSARGPSGPIFARSVGAGHVPLHSHAEVVHLSVPL